MAPMALLGEEATGSMGNDSPLAVMSNKLKPLYNYFKQLFAQVTNPPIDPIREAMVMSLVSFIGPKPNLLDTNNVNPPMRLEVSQPVLGFDDMARLRGISAHTGGKFKSYELNICYPVAWGKEGIEASLASLCAEAVDAVKSGHNILIVSDRAVGSDQVAIPALLATSAIHQHLVGAACAPPPAWSWKPARRARPTTSRCWPATAPKPCTPTWRWKPWSTGAGLPATCRRDRDLQLHQGDRQGPDEGDVQDGHLDLHVVLRRADLRSGRPEQVAGRQVLPRHRVQRRRHRRVRSGRGSAAPAQPGLRQRPGAGRNLDTGGEYAYRVRGEDHMWTPDAIAKLQHSTRANNFNSYKEYAQIINDQTRRHLTCAACSNSSSTRPRRSRSTKSSRPRKSSSASPPARCRSARSRPKRTPRWRSR
jgi:glutamate synthase (NADPH/NADH) large chain